MKLLYALLVFIMVFPLTTLADGLVPCGDPGQPACQTCHIYALVENVFAWVFRLAGIVVTIIIVYGGMRLVTSVGNAVAKSEARKIISAAIVGFILIGCSWFIIKFTLNVLAGNDGATGVWSSLECVAQSTPVNVTPTSNSDSGINGGGTSGGGSSGGGASGW